jgi:hypothetical protein
MWRPTSVQEQLEGRPKMRMDAGATRRDIHHYSRGDERESGGAIEGFCFRWKIASGAKLAAEKGLILARTAKDVPQGLKPAFILRQLRHD